MERSAEHVIFCTSLTHLIVPVDCDVAPYIQLRPCGDSASNTHTYTHRLDDGIFFFYWRSLIIRHTHAHKDETNKKWINGCAFDDLKAVFIRYQCRTHRSKRFNLFFLWFFLINRWVLYIHINFYGESANRMWFPTWLKWNIVCDEKYNFRIINQTETPGWRVIFFFFCAEKKKTSQACVQLRQNIIFRRSVFFRCREKC